MVHVGGGWQPPDSATFPRNDSFSNSTKNFLWHFIWTVIGQNSSVRLCHWIEMEFQVLFEQLELKFEELEARELEVEELEVEKLEARELAAQELAAHFAGAL